MSTGPESGLWVGMICDGNRRFEIGEIESSTGKKIKAEQLSPDELHTAYKAGGEATKRIIEAARDNAVGLFAAWTWSIKNWDRPPEHADAVFTVTEEFLTDLKDSWMDREENKDVRLVHMGRADRLREARPAMMDLMDEICSHTRERAGMVMALMMDYDGPDEFDRAINKWSTSGLLGSARHFLDLPQLGIKYKEVDMRIRTGETDRVKHMNGFMQGYEGLEVRDVYRSEPLPLYTTDIFLSDIQSFKKSEKRRGV